MGHQELICRSCGMESSLTAIRETPETSEGALYCPHCGNRLFE